VSSKTANTEANAIRQSRAVWSTMRARRRARDEPDPYG